MIDTDVHHEVPTEDDLLPYLPKEWQEFVTLPEPQYRIPLVPPIPHVNPHGFDREDTIPPGGGPPASSYALLREQLLDPYDVDHAILTFGTGLYASGISNPYLAAELARAYNDHVVDEWLSRDRRLKGSILLTTQLPELAAKEIRRLKDHPQIVQAIIGTNALGYPFGHPLFDPIHKALADAGLPLAIHAFGENAGCDSPAAELASGRPAFYIEYHTSAASQGLMTHLMSFMLHGTLEQYPTLRLVLLEGGMWWPPGFLRRADTNYKGLRREVPWCKRLPSEYFRERVKLSTQPVDIDSSEDPLWALYRHMDLEGTVMFSSDYPHWDGDEPARVRGTFPKDWREAIVDTNARQIYGFEEPAVPTPVAAGHVPPDETSD